MNKASGGDRILVEIFQILKDDAVKVLHSICQQIGKLSSGHRTSFHSSPKERQCQRVLKLHTIVLISHASKVMLKILQARLQEYVKQELPNVQVGLRKGRETRDQIANIQYVTESKRIPEKHHFLLH